MPSPFPGMDPYLEQHWRSVHHRLITYAGDHLQAALPRQFRVEVEERVFVASPDDAARSVYPDVYITQRNSASPTDTVPTSQTVIAEPLIIEISDEPLREAYLEIIDAASGNRVITAIEFLSPTNKTAGDGYELYTKKQREYLAGAVSVVEVDLTRAGNRGLVLPLSRIPPQHRATYLACVRRSWRPLAIEAYPVALDNRLPVIGIPLREEDADLPLDLQLLLNECYEKGRYEDINYTLDADPPLSASDADWVNELLQTQGLRS